MKNQMQVQKFAHEDFGSLDVVTIDDKPYFPAAECAKMLGYKDATNAIKQHCRWVVKHHLPHPQNPKKIIAKNFIPEGDLYRLIIRSKLPEAVKFEGWICDEIMPSIRKHGAYITEETLSQMLNSPEFTEELLDALAEEHAKNNALENKINEFAPKARYCDKVLLSGNAIPTSIIAKDYGYTCLLYNGNIANIREKM